MSSFTGVAEVITMFGLFNSLYTDRAVTIGTPPKLAAKSTRATDAVPAGDEPAGIE